MAITALALDGGNLVPVPLHEVRQHALFWVDADERTPELEQLYRELGVHALTIEDVFEPRDVPKVEEFQPYLYILAHAAKLSVEHEVQISELDLLIGDGWILTHHSSGLGVCAKVREELGRMAKDVSPARIAHLLLDRLVDQALPVMDAFDDRIEQLEEEALRKRPRKSTLHRILATRRGLHVFRRLAVHQREVLLRVARGEFARIPKDLLPFFRDVHDHMVRLTDLTDDARELLGGALEAHFSMVSNRMNEIMKVLTMMSTVFLPVTFIAGVYGMNFEFMPELHSRYGYPAVLGSMVLTAGGLLWWFRRRGWFD